MWVAKDKDGLLKIFLVKPMRSHLPDVHVWVNPTLNRMNYVGEIDDYTIFPNLKWEDEPIEVELWSKDFWKRTIDDICHKFISKQDSGDYACVNDIVNSITKEICG